MKRCAQLVFLSLVVVAILAPTCRAQDLPPFRPKGTVLKYDQPIQHVIDPNPELMHLWGEDIPSDVDWVSVMQSPTIPPNWVIADDFRDEFTTPVRTVRWWGSYVGPTFGPGPGEPVPIFGPGSEDGYVISFFRDIPAGLPGGPPFSRPGELLGTYVLPLPVVSIKPTPYVGWDMHPIWEYEANLMDAHLDHPSELADQMGFNQRPGEVYWISIMAEVGHLPILVTDPATGETRWVQQPTGKRAQPNPENPEGHFWGWHTSPKHFNDTATMGHLFMPGNQWEYFGWMPIQPQHGLRDMAFQLYTIPEPASILLLIVAIGFLRRRRTV